MVEPDPALDVPLVLVDHHEVIEDVMHHVQRGGVGEEEVEEGHCLPRTLFQGLEPDWLVPHLQLDVAIVPEEHRRRSVVAVLPQALPHQPLRETKVFLSTLSASRARVILVPILTWLRENLSSFWTTRGSSRL